MPPKSFDNHFEVHDHFAELLDSLKPNRVDPHPAAGLCAGVMKIFTKEGKTVDIALFVVDEGGRVQDRKHVLRRRIVGQADQGDRRRLAEIGQNYLPW